MLEKKKTSSWVFEKVCKVTFLKKSWGLMVNPGHTWSSSSSFSEMAITALHCTALRGYSEVGPAVKVLVFVLCFLKQPDTSSNARRADLPEENTVCCLLCTLLCVRLSVSHTFILSCFFFLLWANIVSDMAIWEASDKTWLVIKIRTADCVPLGAKPWFGAQLTATYHQLMLD